MGAGASLKTRQRHVPGSISTNAPSGIDVAADLVPDGIEGNGGADAQRTVAIDIVPGLVGAPGLGSGPASRVVRADIDGDGDLDLLFGRSDGGFSTWAGANDGTFTEIGSAGANPATALLVADLDGDGRPDVVLGTPEADEIWFGDGSGSFDLDASLSISEETRDLAAADFDHDGDLDIVAAGAGAVRVYFNDGAGRFPGLPDGYGGGARTLCVEDFECDGDADVLAGGDGGATLWRNNSFGVFAQGASLAAGQTRDLACADLDLDGDFDVFAGNAGADQVWIGDGDGGFAAGQTFAPSVTNALACTDIDQDAQVDVYVGGEAGLATLLNSGGMLTAISGALEPAVISLAAGDFDCDGDEDVAATGAESGTAVFASSLAGTWGTAVLDAAETGIPAERVLTLEVADIDCDGDMDFADGRGPDVLAFRNQRNEILDGSSQELSVIAGVVRDMIFVDVDLDGDQDLLCVRREDFFTFLNDGDGNFTPAEGELFTSPLLTVTFAIDAGDVDRDGDMDVVVGSLDETDYYFENLGRDSEGGWLGFAQRVRLPQASDGPFVARTTDMRLVDVDTDGDLDLILAQTFGLSNLVYLNEDGIFQPNTQELGARSDEALDVFDIDFDGDLDFVTATDSGIVFYENDGTGSFSEADVLTADAYLEVRLLDINGDKFPELFATRSAAKGSEPAALRWQNDAGTFTNPEVLSLGRAALEHADFDLDGDEDLVLGFEDPALPTLPFWNR